MEEISVVIINVNQMIKSNIIKVQNTSRIREYSRTDSMEHQEYFEFLASVQGRLVYNIIFLYTFFCKIRKFFFIIFTLLVVYCLVFFRTDQHVFSL